MDRANIALNTLDDVVLDLDQHHGGQTVYKYQKKIEMLT